MNILECLNFLLKLVRILRENRHYNNDENPQFTLQDDWPEENFSHGQLNVGQISGVATKTSGDVVIFHRANRKWEGDTFDAGNRLHADLVKTPIEEETILYLKKETGKILGKWGSNMFHFPHGLSIDHEDNLWLTDVGMHQVFKFSAKGKRVLTLGEKFVPGNDRNHFCKPTDVAVEKSGNFFVSDGYCNSRILKYSSKGKLLLSIDDNFLSQTPGFPAPTSFLVPHSLSLNMDNNTLYVADRENGRVLAFNSRSGQYLDQYTNLFGDKVFAITYSPVQGGMLYVINGQSPSQSSIHGYTFHIKEKKIVQEWSPKNKFIYPHDVTCDSSGRFVYVSEITIPGKLWKFKEK